MSHSNSAEDTALERGGDDAGQAAHQYWLEVVAASNTDTVDSSSSSEYQSQRQQSQVSQTSLHVERSLANIERRLHTWLSQDNGSKLILLGRIFLLYSQISFIIFLVLLLLKVDGACENLQWGLVFLPLLLMFVLEAVWEITKYLARRGTNRTSRQVAVLRVWHCVCVSLSLVNITLLLSDVYPEGTSVTLLLIPLWIDACAMSFALCVRSPEPETAPREWRKVGSFTRMLQFMGYGVQGMLISLKVDAFISLSWYKVFLPSLAALVVLLILVAGFSYHLLAEFVTRDLRGPFVICFCSFVKYSSTFVIVWGWIICLFQSLTSLMWLLDKHAQNNSTTSGGADDPTNTTPTDTGDYSLDSTLLPLIGICSVTIVWATLVLCARRRMPNTNNTGGVRRRGAGGSIHIRSSGSSTVEARSRLKPIVRPAPLVRQSSTFFRAADCPEDGTHPSEMDMSASNSCSTISIGNVTAPSQGSSIAGGWGSCYVCEGCAADAVLLRCGHGGTCYECAQVMLNKPQDRRCPICRLPIHSIVRIPLDPDNRYGDIIHPIEGLEVVRPAASNMQSSSMFRQAQGAGRVVLVRSVSGR